VPLGKQLTKHVFLCFIRLKCLNRFNLWIETPQAEEEAIRRGSARVRCDTLLRVARWPRTGSGARGFPCVSGVLAGFCSGRFSVRCSVATTIIPSTDADGVVRCSRMKGALFNFRHERGQIKRRTDCKVPIPDVKT